MHVPKAAETVILDQCAAADVPIHQWTAADGTPRGVKIRALTFKDLMLAERAATDKDGKVDPYRFVAEKLTAAIYDPPRLTVDHILAWNAYVVDYLNLRVDGLGGLAAAPLAAEFARLAGGPPPEPVAPVRRRGKPVNNVGGGPVPEEGAAAGEPGDADAG